MYRTVGNLLFYRSFDLGERIRASVPRGLIVSFKLATFHFSHISCRWCIFTLDIYSRWNERGRRKSRDRIRIRPNFSPFVARLVEFLHFFFFQNLPQRDENNDPFSPTFSQILDLTDFDPKLVCLRFLFHSSKVKERLRPTDSTKETRNKKTTDGVRLLGPSN